MDKAIIIRSICSNCEIEGKNIVFSIKKPSQHYVKKGLV